MLVNTSFNVRGEPIVCTPKEAYRCFMRTEMDCRVIGSFTLAKTAQFNRAATTWGIESFRPDQQRRR